MPLVDSPRTVALLLALGAGAGCAAPPAPMAPVVATTPKRTAAASPPATTEPTPANPVAAPPPTERRSFELLARCTTELAVFPVADAWLGMCGGEHSAGTAFTIDARGALRVEPTIFRDLPPHFALRHAGGRSLAELEVAVDTPWTRGEQRHFLMRRGATFRPMRAPVEFIQPQFLPRWTVQVGERVLHEHHEENGLVMQELHGRPGWLPRPAPGATADCPRRIPQYEAMHADPRGLLHGIGLTCDRGLAVERFVVGESGSTLEMVLPVGGILAPSALRLQSGGLRTVGDATIAFVSFASNRGSGDYRPDLPPVVARRDGAGWTVLDTAAVGETTIDAAFVVGGEVLLQSGTSLFRLGATAVEPVVDGISDVVVGPDGSAWMTTRARGLLRWRGGSLTSIVPEIPSQGDVGIRSVHLLGDGRALITATPSDGTGSVLVRERGASDGAAPATTPLDLHGEAGLISAFAGFYPIDRVREDEVCEPALVLLYRLSRTTPPDYDFPATRAALKGASRFSGVELAELQSLGERHFVAIAPDVATALDLARHIGARVPGSKPQAFCGDRYGPRLPIARRLHIDLHTGDVIPPPATP